MPEALEKWPLELMTELLPRHVEIIKCIDEEFIASVKATYPKATPEELEAKIGAMRILENYMTPAEELKAKAKAAAAKAAKLEAAAAKAAAGEEVAVEDDEECSLPPDYDGEAARQQLMKMFNRGDWNPY